MASTVDREMIKLLKACLREEKERNLVYVSTLKDFIGHLKEEISVKDKDIQYKNDLLKSYLFTNATNYEEVETRLSSSFVTNSQISEVTHETGSNVTSLTSDDYNAIPQGDTNVIYGDALSHNECYISRENDDLFPTVINTDWVTDNRKHRNGRRYKGKSNNEIPLCNRYGTLDVEDNYVDYETPIKDNIEFSDKRAEQKTSKHATQNKINSSRVFVNKHPERNVLPLKNVSEQLPSAYARYAERSKKRSKIAIISDSITKPIDMRKFDDLIINGDAVKRAYGGATASRLNYYAQATIKEEKPDTVIVCAGTNNLTKKKQTAEEITEEIMDIVNTCRRNGTEKVLVSSITCRPEYQVKVDKINSLLKYYASIYNFVFIDNACITPEHIKGDGVHLEKEGIRLLANNYLKYLNRPSLLPFTSIWD